MDKISISPSIQKEMEMLVELVYHAKLKKLTKQSNNKITKKIFPTESGK